MAYIITVLTKIYKEGLEPLGFVKIKGRHPYFVRVVEGEIIQVISFRKVPGHVTICEGNTGYYHPELDEIEVFGGIATVYRRLIDLTGTPINNHAWMKTHREMYISGHWGECDKEFLNQIKGYIYKADEEGSMYEAGRLSLEMTKKIFIPIFDKVTNLNECIEYLEDYTTCMYLGDDRKYGWNDVDFGYNENNEGLLYIKTRHQEDFVEKTLKRCENQYKGFRKSGFNYTEEEYEEKYKRAKANCIKKAEIRDRILNTPEIYENAMKELERRKKANIETLRSYGLDV